MKNRFCRMGKTLLGVACLLSTCGVTYSCSDDFDLDETSPSFLGASIYDELKKRGDFTNTIKLIDDLGYQDVMSKTGSKTLFVAPDSAYDKFFATTTWTDGAGNPVRSYEQLSTAQKRLLFNGSQLNNAYVLEMLTTIKGPVKNLCLRQVSGSTSTDSVPYLKWDELPDDQNTTDSESWKFWKKYRKQSVGGLYLAMDDTEPLLTHFLEAQLNEKNIKHSDISFILNLDGTSDEWKDEDKQNRSYVYDAKIVEGDVTCMNGYFHVLDKVLVTPSNMAEVIRTNGDTKFFSLLLDRFSAPYYDATLTNEYKALHTIAADSVFQKLYVSQRSQIGNITTDPDGNALGDYPSLSYDPGWNQYTVNNSTKEQDMAAMFVPCDDAMREYFKTGGGKMLIQRYNADAPDDLSGVDDATLSRYLYNIPLNVIKPMVANLMKDSFNETVPSKYLTIMNDAQDAMFSAFGTEQAYKAQFKKVLLANNGVVYVMKNVISPATYSSVMAPALYVEGAQVMNTVIHADDNYVNSNYTSAPLRKFYSTYLLSMQSNFTLFLPKDEGLKNYGYVDPLWGVKATSQRFYWALTPGTITTKSDGKYVAVDATAYQFTRTKPLDAANAKEAGRNFKSVADNDITSGYSLTRRQMLIDMVDQHIIVHDDTDGNSGVKSGKNYYLSRSGAPVYIKSAGNADGTGMVVDGGLQIMLNSDATPNNDFDCTVTAAYDMKADEDTYGNGKTYFLDRPMQPTTENVYTILRNHSGENDDYSTNFKEFFDLCKAIGEADFSELLKALYKWDKVSTDSLNKFAIFEAKNGQQVVRFFNNYRYTIFVPTNEAMQKAYSQGLKSFSDIEDYVKDNSSDGTLTGDISDEVRTKAQAMVNTLVNFLKYHFCDQSVFVDNVTKTTLSQSACTDNEGNYLYLTIKQEPQKILLKDAAGRESDDSGENPLEVSTKDYEVTGNTNNTKLYNLMARDFQPDAAGNTSRYISTSSYVAIHAIDNYLLFDKTLNGDFGKAWASTAAAKKFMKRHPLRK